MVSPPHPELSCGGVVLVSVRQKLGPSVWSWLVWMLWHPLWAVVNGTTPQLIN